ncbi:MAG: DUF2116 family Zn-ribbon domain-containing protein [Saprospiraceae bacterium]|nr:DUF2116 family Zn-ribbon domain-containing protein [Saprospiraceae bacterium]
MSLPGPILYCPICGQKIYGRADKVFCSQRCKSSYHKSRKSQRSTFSYPIDKIIHRNWVILEEIYETIGKKKFFVTKAELNKAGFHTRYFTTMQKNSKGKIYFYVYNYGWMDFSESDIMIIRLSKAK